MIKTTFCETVLIGQRTRLGAAQGRAGLIVLEDVVFGVLLGRLLGLG